MNEKLIKVGITQGDINGVGYELILKTLEDARIFEFCVPIVYGSSKILAYHRKVLDFPSVNINMIKNAHDANVNRVNIINCGHDDAMVELSQHTQGGSEAARHAMEKAIADLNAGNIHVLLMAPATEDYSSLIESATGKGKQSLQVFAKDSFRIALATNKIPLSEITASLSVETLKEKIEAIHSALIHDFMVTTPRIAVLALNPEIDGKEEKEIIAPALLAATEAGICCFGPYSANRLFCSEEYKKFDAILAMYYEQALIPFKTITCEDGAYYIAGLPVIVAASEQDVSYEMAGKNLTSEESFRNALYLAIDIFRNRLHDREIYANPLRKMYFERGSDNEKLDLTKDED
ncbi:MAG: 4-hydroxythreonine-4-phosphate dehydrogenase PdxA [Dysgonamonadaceae bacterium]|jgi:4-hydroxythreonine-4-phosphate dehydrogenase|nr:4-hydroxythreonine-4-phosphate dehydrogenase PdxA [Dysgonamonadaceae bacterium]